METRQRKRCRVETRTLWGVSPPAEHVDGGAMAEEDSTRLFEAQQNLPEAAGVAPCCATGARQVGRAATCVFFTILNYCESLSWPSVTMFRFAMETRQRKRCREETRTLWGVSPPAKHVDGGAMAEEDWRRNVEAQQNLPEAAGVGDAPACMELGSRPARVARVSRIEPPVWRINGAVSKEDSALLLKALQALPEKNWTGSGEGFGDASKWIELPVLHSGAVKIPPCLQEHADVLTRCVEGLATASDKKKKGRVAINRYMPSGARKPTQWVLRPHCDDARVSVSMTLSLRSPKSGGGALVVSTLPDGQMLFYPGKPNTVDTRRNSTKEYQQVHGQVLKFHGSKCCHFVRYTTRACRYSLTVLMK
jgi:hypothetical protein